MRFLSFALVLALSATTFDSMAGRMQMCGEKITTEAGSITFSELINVSNDYKKLFEEQASLMSEIVALSGSHKALFDAHTLLSCKLDSLSNRYKVLQTWNIGLTIGFVGVVSYLIYEKCRTVEQAEQ